ncbi:MAG: phospholipase, partial [Maribacter sp.]
MKEIQSLRSLRLVVLPFLFLVVVILFLQCTDDRGEIKPIYDPSLPVEITSFSPDSGGVSTQMLIYGANFGTDTSLIKVFVNGKRAPFIGSTGTELYVMVPSRADTGYVSVVVGSDDQLKQVTSETEFNYIYKPSVS